MKIDVHVHTKKLKKGDAPTRNIVARRFHEIISSTDVRIVAITNHNHFDLSQYNEFVKEVDNDFQIWPGVELDIRQNERRGHLLVIVSPVLAQSLEKLLTFLNKNTKPDDFHISIAGVVKYFDALDPLYIAHYKKQPDLSDTDIDELATNIANKGRVLKEATNAISAGIFLSHGHLSIYGSDIQDWDKYQMLSNNLPDLRLPVESFEQFCLLLNKDQAAINSLLDKKSPETISIKPFDDGKSLELTVYNDINVFFGSKGTGKSKILQAIALYYAKKGITANIYESSSAELKDIYDLNCRQMTIDLKDHGIDYCTKEIDSVRKAQEVDVTSLSKYLRHYSDKITNVNAQKLKIKDFTMLDVQVHNREFTSINTVRDKFLDFKNYLEKDESIHKFIDKSELKDIMTRIASIVSDLEKKRLATFTDLKIAHLFNSLIKTIKLELTKKTGIHAKPSATGFREYASNRIKIELAAKKILENINNQITMPDEFVGCLDEKGDLYCKTEIKIQDGNVRDGKFQPYKSVNKNPQRDFSNAIRSVIANLYTPHLFEKIAELNSIDGVATIPTIIELLMINRRFIIDDKTYKPSSGEESMLMLHKELNEDKEVYVLDEPEKSLGNEYINNVIVPLIKEKAKIGKKIFIATHDANIAVRTLPYNSIYRKHGINGYKTYVGNPFSNNLINIDDDNDKIDWKEISMRTLEGGKNAFGERRRIYGNP